MAAANDPIGQRLMLLSDLYAEFAAEPNARILRWVLESDEVRMVDAFVAMEQDDRAGQLAEIFLTLEAPFERTESHGLSLRDELLSGYATSASAIVQSGVEANWRAPEVDPREDDVACLIRTCQSFLDHYAFPGRIVLLLRPVQVRDARAYDAWLQRFALAAPERVRAMLFDLSDQRMHQALADRDPECIVSCEPQLNMPQALEELSVAGGNFDTPGGQFRMYFVKLGSALRANDLDEAIRIGELALAIATSQNWHYLQVPVHMVLAGALSGAGRHDDAFLRYRAAEQAALDGETNGGAAEREICPRLRMQARLGLGAGLIHARSWKAAAELYEATAPLAEALADLRSVLDCHRLASFCLEQDKQLDEAFRIGLLGLAVARSMDVETRETSSFAYLGEALLRLTRSGSRRASAQSVGQEIERIAGTPDWRPQQAAAKAPQAGDQRAVR